ncbi:piggyBac transposable element-derived protein 4-like [Macrobrachium rosenbergii]|uniref:piggyBac transposable element-derived protein 4-like n=1 Tax=Macrobrachium rosenbergii TaxID=79674 RepID=UPI0034D72BB3
MSMFLGLIIIIGIFPAPEKGMYWQTGKIFSMPGFARIMSRNRFDTIYRYFHTANRKAIPRGNNDRLFLVRPVINYLKARFRATYTPESNVTLDEGLMPYKGRLSIKTYNPKKPGKYGIKFYMLCEAKSRYVIDFLTYGGSTSTLKDIVFTLMGPLFDKGYHVFMDNYYNSIELAEELYSHGVLCSGTLCLVRKGAPNFPKNLTHQRVPRNAMHFHRRGNVFIICW